jgi:hypothetical protein
MTTQGRVMEICMLLDTSLTPEVYWPVIAPRTRKTSKLGRGGRPVSAPLISHPATRWERSLDALKELFLSGKHFCRWSHSNTTKPAILLQLYAPTTYNRFAVSPCMCAGFLDTQYLSRHAQLPSRPPQYTY